MNTEFDFVHERYLHKCSPSLHKRYLLVKYPLFSFLKLKVTIQPAAYMNCDLFIKNKQTNQPTNYNEPKLSLMVIIIEYR